MAGISLHAAAGQVCAAAVDARDLAAAACARGFAVQRLLTGRAATRGALLGELARAAARLRARDTLLVSFSGHGSREGWWLEDGLLPFGAVCEALPRRGYVCVIADCCHAAAFADGAQTLLSANARVQTRVSALLVAACGANDVALQPAAPNTRSAFVARLLRLVARGFVAFDEVLTIRLTPVDARFEATGLLRPVPAPARRSAGRSSCGTGAGHTR
jgi:Caspase domain